MGTKKTPEQMEEKEYIEAFIGSSSGTKDKENVDTKWEKALNFAVKTREFEIELYWKRSNMFMLMNGAAFVGFYTVAKECFFKGKRLYELIILLLGFTFAVAWHLICRGSLFWQENWEAHIDALEDLVMGPIYRYVHYKGESKYRPWKLVKSYPYSVSKIMALTSFLAIFFWIVTLIVTLILPAILCLLNTCVPSALKLCKDELTIAAIAILAGIGIGFLFHRLCKSGFMNEDPDGTDSEKNPKAEFIARKSWSVSETMYRSQKNSLKKKTT